MQGKIRGCERWGCMTRYFITPLNFWSQIWLYVLCSGKPLNIIWCGFLRYTHYLSLSGVGSVIFWQQWWYGHEKEYFVTGRVLSLIALWNYEIFSDEPYHPLEYQSLIHQTDWIYNDGTYPTPPTDHPSIYLKVF